MLTNGFIKGKCVTEIRSGQVIKVTACQNDSESESAYVEGVVVSPGRYVDPENQVNQPVRFAFFWSDFTEV